MSPGGAPASAPTFADVRAAARRLAGHVHRTPVLTCRAVDAMVGMHVFFKCENFQKVGAFKFRGATNAVLSLPDAEAARGVLTHSSGNHAQALALAAHQRGIPAWIVMPTDAPTVKRRAVAGYGATIVDCEPTLASRESTARRLLEETGAAFVHPYDDARVIAGQGTAALELLEEVPDLDAVVAPVGGGGLCSGTAIAARGLAPGVRVFGAEPERVDDAARSLAAGRRVEATGAATIADGLRTSLSQLTFEILRAHVAGIATVAEAEIVHAMRTVWERVKIVIEPSAAVPLAACARLHGTLAGRRVGILLSGGNVDLDRLPW